MTTFETTPAATDADTHTALLQAEVAACQPTSWDRWANQAEQIAGHSLDGDEPSGDRYSMDSAYDAWRAGITPAGYVRSFTA